MVEETVEMFAMLKKLKGEVGKLEK